jgi:hypothetical protein
MDAPTSVLAETYIQHIEQIIAYFRYVDDIIYDQNKENRTHDTIYDKNKENIEHTLNKFNKIQLSIKFTIEKELHKSINFLDLTIHRKDRYLRFSIYRKPKN